MAIEDLILYQKIYDFILYSFPILEKFPKTQKWVLAQDIQKSMLNLLKYIMYAHKNYYRREMLRRADIELELIRCQIRLAKDLSSQYISIRRYGVFCAKMNEIGKIFGGYAKK